MKKILHLIIIYMSLWLFSACDVHEWPETPEFVKLHLRLNYETDMTEWYHQYDGQGVVEQGLGETYDNRREYGQIRYIVRAYPVSEKQRTTEGYRHEFVFTRSITEGYDHEMTLDLLPGNYNIMVWSDLIPTSGTAYFYDVSNFAEIRLLGDHQANTDYRDAFRGKENISLIADVMEKLPDTLDIVMQRPLAKYEFITTDVQEFLDKEAVRVASKANSGNTASDDDASSRVINLEDYKVVFYYKGFMPDAYSIHTDKPVDSSTGVFYESTLKKLTESEASMGFDFVMVNGQKSVVTVQVGIYDKEDVQLSLSDPIEIPLKRAHHTIIRGILLMSEASGGVTISPDFDGDYNLILP